MSSGNYTQWKNVDATMAVGKTVMESGCVRTRVTTTDNDTSGIVFGYIDLSNYYVFEATDQTDTMSVRQVLDGVSTTLATGTWAGNWDSTTMMVCFKQVRHHRRVHRRQQREAPSTPATAGSTAGATESTIASTRQRGTAGSARLHALGRARDGELKRRKGRRSEAGGSPAFELQPFEARSTRSFTVRRSRPSRRPVST